MPSRCQRKSKRDATQSRWIGGRLATFMTFRALRAARRGNQLLAEQRENLRVQLLEKLGREEDAYHATCVILMDYAPTEALAAEAAGDDESRAAAAGLEPYPLDESPYALDACEIDRALRQLPAVKIDHARTPSSLSPSTFLATLVDHVLDTT